MDVFWTVVAGVGVFVVGQAINRFIIEPLHEYRNLVGEIAHVTMFYLTVTNEEWLSSPAEPEDAFREMRSLAGQLLQRTYAIPFYGLFARLGVVPSWSRIDEAYSNIIGYSNSFGRTDSSGNRSKRLETISRALDFRSPTG